VELTSPADAARAYPDLFPTGEKAAREALAREAVAAGRQRGEFGPDCSVPVLPPRSWRAIGLHEQRVHSIADAL
jgi:hypothetical protein